MSQLAAFPLVAQRYDAATRSVVVTPSGVDDTRALRTAFDVCLAVGAGCSVRLGAGVHYAQQLEVWGFNGTVTGVGSDETVIEALAPLPISPPDLDITNATADPAGGPVLLTFRDGHLTLRDLTIRVRAGAPTSGWTFFGTRILGLQAVVLIEGDDFRVDLERVVIETGPGDGEPENAGMGVWVRGIQDVHRGQVGDMVAAVTIRESRIVGPETGLLVSNVENAALLVRDSTVSATRVGITFGNVGRSLVELRGNTVTGVDVAVSVGQRGRVPQGPTTVVMTDNHLRAAGGSGAVVVELMDATEAATQFVWIERNLIELEDAVAAIRGRGEGLVARGNSLVGSARTGIAVGGRPGSATRPWVVVGNDVSGLTVGDVNVTIRGDAIGAVVVCVGPTTVREGGRGSVVSCD